MGFTFSWIYDWLKRMKLVDSKDLVLYSIAEEVTDIAKQVTPLVSEMTALMQSHHGIGLAAPQIGVSLRFFIYGGKYWNFDKPHVVINPKITWASSDIRKNTEGCLSFPGIQKDGVERPESVRVEYTDLNGNLVKRLLGSHEARIFQHEFDHLNGICIFGLTTKDKIENTVP